MHTLKYAEVGRRDCRKWINDIDMALSPPHSSQLSESIGVFDKPKKQVQLARKLKVENGLLNMDARTLSRLSQKDFDKQLLDAMSRRSQSQDSSRSPSKRSSGETDWTGFAKTPKINRP